jgi:hypothetical protein
MTRLEEVSMNARLPEVGGLAALIADSSAAIEQRVIAWRRDLHQHP